MLALLPDCIVGDYLSRYNEVTIDNYVVAPDKISESPASNTAIVEHLKSFPQAVPSSICVCQRESLPPKPLKRLLLRDLDCDARGCDLLGRGNDGIAWKSSHYFQQSDGRSSWKAWSSLRPDQQWSREIHIQSCSHSSSLLRRGGVLPAMMTSLAFPDRSDFKVDLYPRVTAAHCQ